MGCSCNESCQPSEIDLGRADRSKTASSPRRPRQPIPRLRAYRTGRYRRLRPSCWSLMSSRDLNRHYPSDSPAGHGELHGYRSRCLSRRSSRALRLFIRRQGRYRGFPFLPLPSSSTASYYSLSRTCSYIRIPSSQSSPSPTTLPYPIPLLHLSPLIRTVTAPFPLSKGFHQPPKPSPTGSYICQQF